jgi:hypothetical protein
LPELYERGRTNELVNSFQAYIEKYNITNFTASVNGQVIREYPVFRALRSAILAQGNRFLACARQGEITNATDFGRFVKENGLLVESLVPPLKIDIGNRFSIDQLLFSTVQETVELFAQSQSGRAFTNPKKKYQIPVLYFDPGEDWQIDPTGVPCEIRVAKNGTITNQAVRELLRLARTKTMVGPLLFDHHLTHTELDYALRWVEAAFVDGAAATLNSSQLNFVLMWRSSQGLQGVQRGIQMDLPSAATIRVPGDTSLEWSICDDIFNERFRMTVEMAVHVAELGIAEVSVLPVVPVGQVLFPAHFHSGFVPVITVDGISEDHPSAVIATPPGWVREAKPHEAHSMVITAVTQIGVAPGVRVVAIGGQAKAPLDNGYFVFTKPIGSFSAQGVREKTVFVFSLLPKIHFFTPANESVNYTTDENRLHVLSFATKAGLENQTKTMMYTLMANVSIPVKLWLLDGLRSGVPDQFDTEILPRFWPSFLPVLSDTVQYYKAARLALLDLLLPLDVSHVLLVDPTAVFRGDAAVFKRLDLENAVCAAPLISSSKKKTLYWNVHEFVTARFKRPFHSTTLVWIDLRRWRERNAGDIFRTLYTRTINSRDFVGQIDDDIFNLLQLDIQVITLPEETTFCSSRNGDRSKAANAFAIMTCDPETEDLLGKELTKLRDAAYLYFQ